MLQKVLSRPDGDTIKRNKFPVAFTWFLFMNIYAVYDGIEVHLRPVRFGPDATPLPAEEIARRKRICSWHMDHAFEDAEESRPRSNPLPESHL
jgi:hypothetical protein